MPDLVPFSRRFHWDLLLRILQLSDTPTLAILGAVSFDLLVASSPLLCRDVTVKSWESLQKLFCERKETSPPSHINPLLSLSQIQTLHLDFPSSKPVGQTYVLSASRIDHLPLPLDVLRVTFFQKVLLEFEEIYHSLLPMLNPRQAEYDFGPGPDGCGAAFCFPMSGRVESSVLEDWTRIEVLTLRGAILIQSRPGNTGAVELAFLPPPSINQRRLLRVPLDCLLPPSWVKSLAEFSVNFATEAMRDGYIVLVMKTEKEKKEMEGIIRMVEPERWRKNFAVVVEE